MEMHTCVCFFVCVGSVDSGDWTGSLVCTCRASALPLSQLLGSPAFRFLINVYLSLENTSRLGGGHNYGDYSVSQQQGSNSWGTGAVSTNHSTKVLIHLLTKAIGACYIQESLKMTFLF